METPDLRYEIIVYWSDEDDAFIAEVSEAVENAFNAARAWIETALESGREIPEPKGRRLQFA